MGKDPEKDKVDEASEESFPASDAPANTGKTGIGGADGNAAISDAIYNNREAGRFEMTKNGQLSVLYYERRGNTVMFMHTEVPPSLRGHHVGDALVKAALAAARAEGLRVVAVCPFVRAYMSKHPEAGS